MLAIDICHSYLYHIMEFCHDIICHDCVHLIMIILPIVVLWINSCTDV